MPSIFIYQRVQFISMEETIPKPKTEMQQVATIAKGVCLGIIAAFCLLLILYVIYGAVVLLIANLF